MKNEIYTPDWLVAVLSLVGYAEIGALLGVLLCWIVE